MVDNDKILSAKQTQLTEFNAKVRVRLDSNAILKVNIRSLTEQ